MHNISLCLVASLLLKNSDFKIEIYSCIYITCSRMQSFGVVYHGILHKSLVFSGHNTSFVCGWFKNVTDISQFSSEHVLQKVFEG